MVYVEKVQRLAAREVKDMKDLSHADRLSEHGLQTLEKRRSREVGMAFRLRNSFLSPFCSTCADIP